MTTNSVYLIIYQGNDFSNNHDFYPAQDNQTSYTEPTKYSGQETEPISIPGIEYERIF